MIYCKKCARLLETDVRECPYCGSIDEKFIGREEKPDPLQALDDHIRSGQEIKPEGVQPAAIEETETKTINYAEPQQQTITKTSNAYQDGSPQYGAVKPEPPSQPNSGHFAGMVILSVFIAIAGLVVGMLYMTGHKGPSYKQLGTVMLIVSIISIFFQMMCCCVIGLMYLGDF
ncbi:MAG: hypothetical protein FWE82_08135 [Defluviitaleaceae bacterium]|nr:hypothetical protein [Defluviitaleaceae bacterium]